jgi:hypothetical protein
MRLEFAQSSRKPAKLSRQSSMSKIHQVNPKFTRRGKEINYLHRFLDTPSENASQGKKNVAQREKNASQEKKNAAQGKRNAAQGERNAAQGKRNVAQGKRNVAQGKRNAAQGKRNVAQGERNVAQGKRNAAQGKRNVAQRKKNVAQGKKNVAQKGAIRVYSMNCVRRGGYPLKCVDGFLHALGPNAKPPRAASCKYKTFMRRKGRKFYHQS